MASDSIGKALLQAIKIVFSSLVLLVHGTNYCGFFFIVFNKNFHTQIK